MHNLASTSIKSKHIIFDENSSSGSDDEETVPDKIQPLQTSSGGIKSADASQISRSLVKIRHEKSFGFEIKGNSTESGKHHLDSIEIGSAAHRAGLRSLDKLVKLNGIHVEHLNAEGLISVMESELKKNNRHLEIVVERGLKKDKKDMFDYLDEESEESDGDEGITQLKKRFKTFEAMERMTTKTLTEKIKDTFNQKQNKSKKILEKNLLKKSLSTPNLGPAVDIDYIEIIDNSEDQEPPVKTLEQIRQESLDKITFTSPQRPYRRQNVPSKLILNNKAKDLQRILSDQGHYVQWQHIIHDLIKHYEGCEHIGDLGLVQADQLHTISELIRLQRRIDTMLISYESRTPCVTLMDIEQFICNDYNYYISNQNGGSVKVSGFDELCVGPLVKNQIVRQILRLPESVRSVRQLKPIKLATVFKDLEAFLKENDLWTEKKVKQDEFEAYLVKKHKVNELYMLGVKINSIAMLIGSVKNVARFCGDTFRDVRSKISTDLKQTFDQEKKILNKYFSDHLASLRSQSLASFDPESSIIQNLIHTNSRSSYLNTPSIELIENFLGVFEKIFNETELSYVSPFLKSLQESDYLRDSFQLAICLGKHDIDACLTQIEFNKNNTDFESDQIQYRNEMYKKLLKRVFFLIFDMSSATNKEIRNFFNAFLKQKDLRIVSSSYKAIQEPQPSYKSVAFDYDTIEHQSDHEDENCNEQASSSPNSRQDPQELKSNEEFAARLSELITSKFEPCSNITLDQLSKLESEVFNSSKTSFIDLLIQNKIQFERRSIRMDLLPNINSSQVSISKRREYIVEFTRQLMEKLDTQKVSKHFDKLECVERIICSYYNVACYEDLSIGKFETLIDQINTTLNTVNTIDIVYIDSLLSNSDLIKSIPKPLDKLTIDDRNVLIQKILECPLLEDLHVHLDWHDNLNYGYLKDFLIDLNSRQIKLDDQIVHIDLLEIDLNCLLKLTRNTDIKILKEAIESGDIINTAGHLVSLIALKYRTSTPNSLIANEIESSLAVFSNKCGATDQFYSFIIDLICRLPIKLTNRIIFEFLLGPVAKLKNDNLIKENVFKHLVAQCIDNKDVLIEPRLKRFLQIGNFCSISEWSLENYHSIQSERNKIRVTKVVNEFEPINEALTNVTSTEWSVSKTDIAELNPIEDIKGTQDTNEYDHVIAIRQRYGIDIELDSGSKAVTDSLKGVIGRSLESLSNELYNKEMHFVLELIQNADDNKYSENSVSAPTLVFLVEENEISLFNNEIGFDKQNISAICDVKASTKGTHQRGYIGRKGIGFKSVFTVTDRPEIHSNNFHINFDLANGHIGYILPNWISSVQKSNSIVNKKSRVLARLALSNTNVSDLNTCIHLPLKSKFERQRHKSATLSNNFNDIKPYLLLFLNRLRNLVIMQSSRESQELTACVYCRNDLSDSLVEIESCSDGKASKQKWLVMKDSLKVPANIMPNETPVISTDLCLAFPIDNLTKKSLTKLDVFAYLPLRSFGFPFIIQADFVVPASRQDLMQDSEWNQWIIKQIPKLFVKAHELFKRHEEFSDKIEALKAYLRFIPLEEEIVGCFQHIPSEIVDLLRNEELLPVIYCDQVMWKRPFECVMIQGMDELVREVLTGDLLKKHLGRYYLHPGLVVSDAVNPKVLANLGVRVLDVNDLIEILKSVLSENNQFEDVGITSKWLVVLHHCLSGVYSIQQQDNFIDQIKQLPFIPIKRDSKKCLISLASTTVFFSNQITSTYSQLLKSTESPESTPIESLIEGDLNLLDSQGLLGFDNPLHNSQVISILKLLGVKSFDAKEIIEKHIYPVLVDEKKSDIREQSMKINYLMYIFECWKHNVTWFSYFSPKLKGLLSLKTTQGYRSPDTTSIYLTPYYGNKHNLKKELPSFSWCLIDECYLKKQLDFNLLCKKSKRQKESDITLNWHRFLTIIGCKNLFTPEALESNLKECTEPEKLIDYTCPVFDFYVEKIETNQIDGIRGELTRLYKIIEDTWESSLKKFKYKIQFSSGSSVEGVKPIEESKFYSKLKYSKWILAECTSFKSNGNGIVEAVRSETLEKPKDIYIPEQIFQRYYGLNVPYAITIPIKSQLSKDLEFKNDFSISDFLEVFEGWRDAALIGKTGFFASITQMQNIYILFSTYLNSYETKQNLIDRLSDLTKDPIIFIPNMHSTNCAEIQQGQFYLSSEVYWHDPTGLFLKYEKSYLKPINLLDQFYNGNCEAEKIGQVFIKDFNIAESPELKAYIDLLDHISLSASANKSGYSEEETLADVYKLYEVIVDKCVELSQSESSDLVVENSSILNYELDSIRISVEVKSQLLDAIKFKWIIPCFNNKWVSLVTQGSLEIITENNPLLVDDTRLAEHFIDKLNLILTPSTHLERTFQYSCSIDILNAKHIFFLTKLLDLKLFSQSVTLDLENITEDLREAPTAQNTCRKLLPFIQCFMYYRPEFKGVYQYFSQRAIQSNKDASRLLNMKFYSVQNLHNIYRCKHDPSIFAAVSNKACHDTKSPHWKYFCRADILLNDKEILKGFLKIFLKSELCSELNEKELIRFCLLMNQFSNYHICEEDRREIERDYHIKLNLPNEEIPWSIKESSIGQTDQVHTEMCSFRPNKKLKTRNEKNPLKYEQLSRDQIKIPEVAAEDRMETLSKSMHKLVGTMSENFCAEKFTEQKELSVASGNSDSQWLARNSLNNLVSQTDYTGKKSQRVSEYIVHIGRWGEIWVNEMLKKKYSFEVAKKSITIEWMNEESESGLPFDFRITRGHQTEYIEVKSTTKLNQESFPISYNELMFAQNNSSSFQIYRLYNVGAENPNDLQMRVIKEIPSLLNSHGLNLFIVI